MSQYYQLISVALQKGNEANIRIAALRATIKHVQRTGVVGSSQRGLSTCQMQNMIGAHERAEAFGSQVVA